MTTQADSARALRKSLDSPALGDQAPTMPEGWGCFVSEPAVYANGVTASRWYASSPYPVERLKRVLGEAAWHLAPTVWADTWEELCGKVAEQERLYARLSGGQHG
ncbi:hypothetical protein CPT_Shaeky_066 [Streptomyces phage Shaeky]|uniref:Uncharacterized protein n=1 Tax=Streptomyces phage Shaeky TaxID=2767586 RepID=A0A873WHD2_9CAUD|nr:hypothetical protein CPT_Shaeky_066 [Streptomyces phage Shaeky]